MKKKVIARNSDENVIHNFYNLFNTRVAIFLSKYFHFLKYNSTYLNEAKYYILLLTLVLPQLKNYKYSKHIHFLYCRPKDIPYTYRPYFEIKNLDSFETLNFWATLRKFSWHSLFL